MKRIKLDTASIPDLVERFVAIALAQDRALLYSEISKYNRLFDQMTLVNNELKRRSGDQRRVLVSLFNHQNVQVRLKAAYTTLAIEPVAARQTIQRIYDAKAAPQALDAGMTLSMLDDGRYVPT